MSLDKDEAVDRALEQDDASELAKLSTRDELERMNLAEEMLQKRHSRQQRRSKFVVASQTMVGYVALAGFFANAYQNWSSEQRWSKEFERAQRTDKYRSFFETTALATDPGNRDKRLVGYALLKEFMDDPAYQPKAMLLLEESLARELRNSTAPLGVDEDHDAAFVAILSALARTSLCSHLEGATGSVGRLVKNGKGPTEERSEIFHMYVRWLFGRAIEICPTAKALRSVRRPLQQAALNEPGLVHGNGGKLRPADANARIAEILRDHCLEEIGSSDVASCPTIIRRYADLCAEWKRQEPEIMPEEKAACERLSELHAPSEAP